VSAKTTRKRRITTRTGMRIRETRSIPSLTPERTVKKTAVPEMR